MGFSLGGAASGAAIGSSFGPWGTAIGAIGGALFGGGKKKQQNAARPSRPAALDVTGINSRYSSLRPEGWLTGQDYAESERRRGRGTASVAASYGDERARAIGRAASTKKSSASVDRNQARLADSQAAQIADIGSAAEGQLYQTRMGREADSANRNRYAWGSELGAASQNFAANQANYVSEMGWARGDEALGREADAGMWNSILEAAPAVIDSFKKSTADSTTTATAAVATPRPDTGTSSWSRPNGGGGNFKQSVMSY